MRRTLMALTALLAFALPVSAQQGERPAKYLLLATNRTGTMQKELNEAGGCILLATSKLVAMTVFRSTFGGDEAAAILEAEITDER